MDSLNSLRKKKTTRPKISAPRQISNPVTSPLPSTTERPRLGSPIENKSYRNGSGGENTTDYVKRRYSTKVGQLPTDYFNAPAVPPLPSQHAQRSPPLRHIERLPTEKPTVDLQALQDPNLNPEQHIARALANVSESDIREYQQELTMIKNRTFTDIQHNVYENRDQFIRISQEADKLKTEMRTLRSLMSDLTNTLGQTNAALGISNDVTSSRKHANRSSVANLEAMWSIHLQELWRRVEGSQKHLPAIPGRHVVHESGRWIELNTATWKPRRRVHLILLNDHLLVAIDKKRIDQVVDQENNKIKANVPQPQFVADRCWPLSDLEISDLAGQQVGNNSTSRRGVKDPAQYAINVRSGFDSFTYTVPEPESGEKANLLSKVRKELANLRKSAQADAEERLGGPVARPSPTPSPSHGRESLRNFNLANGATDLNSVSKAGQLVDLDGREQPLRWLEVQVDELDIDVALQHFDEAVESVDRMRQVAKANEKNKSVRKLVDGKVQERAVKLARALIRQMIDTNSWLTATQQHVTWLTKLGFEARASEAFLEARSHVILTRSGQCADLGSQEQYLSELSFIYFTLIRNTISIYQSCFTPAMSSACIAWAKTHVENFNTTLGQQVRKMGSEERMKTVAQAKEAAGALKEVGIDFHGLVGKGLCDDEE